VLCVGPGPTPSGFQATAGTTVSAGQPGLMEADAVVRAALRALDRGRVHVVPGLPNRLAALFGRLVPLRLAARAAGAVNRRRGG
jgi:short-subunit dehydrogenase